MTGNLKWIHLPQFSERKQNYNIKIRLKFHSHWFTPMTPSDFFFSIDEFNYCFLCPEGMRLETTPVTTCSTSVISSCLPLWLAVGGKWQEVCFARKLVGYHFLCLCALRVICIDIPTYDPSNVHLCSISPPVPLEYQIWARLFMTLQWSCQGGWD